MKLSRLIDLASQLQDKFGDFEVRTSEGSDLVGFISFVADERESTQMHVPVGERVAKIITKIAP